MVTMGLCLLAMGVQHLRFLYTHHNGHMVTFSKWEDGVKTDLFSITNYVNDEDVDRFVVSQDGKYIMLVINRDVTDSREIEIRRIDGPVVLRKSLSKDILTWIGGFIDNSPFVCDERQNIVEPESNEFPRLSKPSKEYILGLNDVLQHSGVWTFDSNRLLSWHSAYSYTDEVIATFPAAESMVLDDEGYWFGSLHKAVLTRGSRRVALNKWRLDEVAAAFPYGSNQIVWLETKFYKTDSFSNLFECPVWVYDGDTGKSQPLGFRATWVSCLPPSQHQ